MNISFQNQSNGSQLTGKLIVLAILIFVTWVATMFVWAVIQDREHRQTEAADKISAQWSRPQTIAGPVLTIPVEKRTVTTTGERVVTTSILTLLPQELAYTSEIDTELLSRGIFETPVYTTAVAGSGSFDLTDVTEENSADTTIRWDEAVISVNISDPRGISSMFDIALDVETHTMLPSSEFRSLDGSGVHVPVAIDPAKDTQPFSFELPLKGSRELSFLPLGESTSVQVSSSWNAPSFTGEFLPEERTITEDGFTASWHITSYGKNLPQSWSGTAIDTFTLQQKAFGVGLYQEVDFYTMVDRATKYSILFIGLTFLTFFMFEVLAGLRIHPMQYLLVGFAIALFYLLLLSFAEIIGFMSAYLVAATAITLLITAYCFSVLRAKKRAFGVAALLASLYGYLYILLQMDEYTLLFGSLLLFSVLATVMYITRNLDWYEPRV